MSEQKAEQTSGDSGSVDAGPAVPSDAQDPSVAASLQEPTGVESPKLVPEQGTPDETPKIDQPKAHADKTDGERADARSIDAARSADRIAPGRIMIMSSREHAWDGDDARPAPESEPNAGIFGKRRLAALAAVVAVAAMAGALGGAMATISFGHFAGDDTTGVANHALEASVARIDADIQVLKAGAEHTAKLGTSQFTRTSERLDKIEKAQAEPAAKLARLSEAVEKLHAAPPAAAAAAKEVTGSISPAATTPAAAPKVEIARLPTVDGWWLRDVANGGALIEGRQGIFEVYAGDPVPGLGRIDAIRRQDGRWVVVTSRGLIVAR